MNVDWNDLRHFLALAERGGLVNAAALLKVSHVTVMRRVRALEHALGIDLFIRRPDGHRLTPAGAELAQKAREGGAIVDEAIRHVMAEARSAQSVRITTTEIVANWVLLPHLASLAERPDLLIDASPSERDLLDGSATLAIRFRRPLAGPYRIRKLGVVRMALYARRDKARTPGGYVGWTGDFENIGLSHWLRDQFDGAPPALAFTTIEAHRVAARAGLGIAALPTFKADVDPELSRLWPERACLDLTAWLTIPEAIAQRRAVQSATKLIRDAFAAVGLC